MKELLENFIQGLKSKNSNRNDIYIKSMDFPDDTISFDNVFSSFTDAKGINLYPCDTKGLCQEKAVFISFQKAPFDANLKKNKLVNLQDILPVLVQQVLGSCYKKNTKIALLTDKIDTDIFQPWMGNLRTISQISDTFEIYLMKPDGNIVLVNDMIGI